jgi:hypothetical protein
MNDLCARVASRLVSGEHLTPDELAHTVHCRTCAPLVRRFAVAEKLLAASEVAPPWFTERALARIRRRKLATAFLREPFPWKWVVLGTALGAAALGFWTFVGVPSIHVQPLADSWVLQEHQLAAVARVVRAALPALAALALSVLPFLAPARGQRFS